jgi:hypothetical protein
MLLPLNLLKPAKNQGTLLAVPDSQALPLPPHCREIDAFHGVAWQEIQDVKRLQTQNRGIGKRVPWPKLGWLRPQAPKGKTLAGFA